METESRYSDSALPPYAWGNGGGSTTPACVGLSNSFLKEETEYAKPGLLETGWPAFSRSPEWLKVLDPKNLGVTRVLREAYGGHNLILQMDSSYAGSPSKIYPSTCLFAPSGEQTSFRRSTEFAAQVQTPTRFRLTSHLLDTEGGGGTSEEAEFPLATEPHP